MQGEGETGTGTVPKRCTHHISRFTFHVSRITKEEDTVHEVFPVLAGAAIGAVVARFLGGRMLAMTLAAVSVIAGVLASFISGELALSWGFVPVDVLQVLLVAVVTSGLVRVWQRRARRI
jgi:hypothetical protein